MFFIAMLIASTMAIAGSAAFFSVYGLAFTFSGTFWSVVVMGASLEAGKLVAASYLYRYWNKTNFLLKSYLIAGVVALMILTSTGIFGYLSSGYQSDVLPLKQMNEQVRLLEEERTRSLERKKQIDEQLTKGPVVSSLGTGNKIDPNATRALRETRRSQESLNRQYKDEQASVTNRVRELDKELLELRQQLVKTEAHIGPITYIAKAFDLEPDNATKYLIFLIIFAFDPMAVALTLAVNIALRLRREEKEAAKTHEFERLEEQYFPKATPPHIPPVEPLEPVVVEVVPEPEPQPEPVVAEVVPNPTVETVPDPTPTPPPRRHIRPYLNSWTQETVQSKIGELVGHYKYLVNKQHNGEILTPDDHWELNAIREILHKHGYSQYLS